MTSAQPPMIGSNGGGASAAISVTENATAVTTVTATDPDAGTTLSYSLSGTDAALFAINSATGVLTFKAAPNFESPGDAGGNNVYDVIVTASDGALTDTQALAITVTNANEAPVITSYGGAASTVIAINEETANNTYYYYYNPVAQIEYGDVDAGGSLSVSLSGADAAKFFVANVQNVGGRLVANLHYYPSLNYPYFGPNFEAPSDADGDNNYDVTITISDGTLTDTQTLAIKVGNVNEAPEITSNGGGASAAMNIAENTTSVTTVAASDIDASTTFAYSITGGADAGKFQINAATGALSFTSALDFETRTDVGGDGVYAVIVTASDGTLTDTQALAITITNANEAPVIGSNGGGDSAAISIAENTNSVTMISAADPDAGTNLTYTLSGTDAALFNIDAATGALSFKTPPNFEAPGDAGGNNVYDVIVTASDSTLSDTQTLVVTVTNANEAPVISSNGGGASTAIAVAENTKSVTTVSAVDPDAGASPTYTLSGTDAALFTIDAVTGVLSFQAAPNFEAPGDAGGNNVYDVFVTASDGTLTDTQALAITVTNANDAPTVPATASFTIDEDRSSGAMTIGAADVDGDVLTYAVKDGAGPGHGEVSFAGGAFVYTPNANANGSDSFTVVVSDGNGGLAEQVVAVTIHPVNDAPERAGGPLFVAYANEDTVLIIRAADLMAGYADPDGDALTVRDVAAASGTLVNNGDGTFTLTSPANFNGEIALTYTVDDGHGGIFETTGVCNVIPINDAPVITSHGGAATVALSIAENTTAVTVISARDPDAGTTLAYAVGGADGALFTIDAVTGALAFKAGPDFEFPADANRDSIYNVTIMASDGSLSDTQALAITVTDAFDYNFVTGTSSKDVLAGTRFADRLLGNAGADTLTGLAGDDVLDGGEGKDNLIGGLGDDLYVVDIGGEKVTELAGEGTDTVQTALGSYTLAQNVENLRFTNVRAHSATGNALSNHIITGSGHDVIDGMAGADVMEGGLGSDVYFIDNSGDIVIEAVGGGTDMVFASVSFGLAADAEIEILTLTKGKQALNLLGSSANNVLNGNINENLLSGLGGDDVLIGGGGADTMLGGDGADMLRGGTGVDTLTGGAGADTFAFDTKPNAKSNLDTLTDFTSGLDTLVFDQAAFKGLGAAGALDAAAFWSGAGVFAAHDADDRLIYNTTTGALFYDVDGSGKGKAVQIALLTGHPDLAFSDILMVA